MGYSNGTHEFIITGRLLSCSRDIVNGDWASEFHDKNKKKLNKNGEPYKVVYLRLGFPKSKDIWTDPNGLGPWWEAANKEAYEYFKGQIPQGFFENSVQDLDTMMDRNGLPLSNREGHANCLALDFNGFYPLTWTRYDFQTNKRVEILDANKDIKRGDYIQIAGNVQANDGNGPDGRPLQNAKPRIQNIPFHATLVGYGKPIITGRDTQQIFGDTPPPMPQGASPTPIGPSQAPATPPQGQPPMGAPASNGYAQTPGQPPGMDQTTPPPMPAQQTAPPPQQPGHTLGQDPFQSAPPAQGPPPSGGPPAFNQGEGVPF